MSNTTYAFLGSGSFSAENNFGKIVKLKSAGASNFDTTGAVELLVDVRLFNKYIGLIKDSKNISIDTNLTNALFYDNYCDLLATDNLTFSAEDLKAGLTPERVHSVGKLSSMYQDFALYVASYFGLPTVNSPAQGFATLFSGDFGFSINNGIFDANEFVSIITGNPDVSGTGYYTQDISGAVSLTNITELLRSAASLDTFGNRNLINGVTANDPLDHKNYGVTDGFYEGDILFIPQKGLEVTLSLKIAPTTFHTSHAVLYGQSLQVAQDLEHTNTLTSTDASGNLSKFSQVTTASPTLIERKISVPLLIKLTNLSLPYISDKSIIPNISSNLLGFRGSFDSLQIQRFSTDAYGVNSDTTIIADNVVIPPTGLFHYYTDNNLASNTKYTYTVIPSKTSVADKGYPYILSTVTTIVANVYTSPIVSPGTPMIISNSYNGDPIQGYQY